MAPMLTTLLMALALQAPAPEETAPPAETPPAEPLPLPAPAPAPAAVVVDDRIFLAPLRAGKDVDRGALQSLEEAVLVAGRKLAINVIGSGDVQALLDVQAAEQAAGCDTDSCAAELADALGAPGLMTGQVAHLGNTWVFTLTHLDRASLKVRGRAQMRRNGDSPAVLLGGVEELMGEVFNRKPTTSLLVPIGGATASVGAVAAGIGAWVWIAAAGKHSEGVQLRDDGDLAGAAKVRDEWEIPYYVGITTTFTGVAVAVVGLGLLAGGIVE
ncbi:MAG: hypothetical protein Q8O67_25545 [Deltaproteobacteria bacterium]|nr:hypothetical protein [Deltaproteobacteria bacterium]